jgi:hypothetical protein
MPAEPITIYSGNLLATYDKVMPDFSSIDGMTLTNTEVGGWVKLNFVSKIPLAGELTDEDNYEYPFLLRESGTHFLLASVHNELVEYIVNKIGGKILTYTPTVNVPSITNDLAKKPGIFCIGALYAKVEGSGNSLRSIALYGFDIAESKLFIDLLPKITPFRIQLRDIRMGIEILSIGTKGEVVFFYRNDHSLRDVDRGLSYLNKGKYISWLFNSKNESDDENNSE